MKVDEVLRAKTSPCRGCGKPILWAKDAAGKAIPLDPRAVVYRITGYEAADTGEILGVRVVNQREAPETDAICFVSHFQTCSKASEFSGRGRATPA